MTATRDTLADVIEDAIDSVHDLDVTHRDYATAAADAVLAQVKPLSWSNGELHQIRAQSVLGEIVCTEFGGVWSHKGKHYPNLLSATCAAEAGYRADLLAALGLGVE